VAECFWLEQVDGLKPSTYYGEAGGEAVLWGSTLMSKSIRK
jgi:hypothetical protein